jgi:hypothetical protein
VQFIDQPNQQPLLTRPCRIIRVPEDRGTDLFGRQLNATGEERDMNSSFVSTTAAGAGAVDHDLSLAHWDRAPVEQACGPEAVVDAWYASKRREQCQRRYA